MSILAVFGLDGTADGSNGLANWAFCSGIGFATQELESGPILVDSAHFHVDPSGRKNHFAQAVFCQILEKL